MKAIATLLVLFLAASSKAQYQSIFGQNSTEWSELNTNLGWSFSEHFTVSGDTMVNGLPYKKASLMNFIALPLLLREDTTTGKVWSLSISSNFTQEYLIADFSLSLGDTFLVYRPYFLPSIETAIVDSVYIMSGKKHIRFNYSNPNSNFPFKLMFIEGVGPNFGFWYQPQTFNLFPILLCKSKDNVQEYANTVLNGSCTVMGLESNQVQESIRLIRQDDGYLVQFKPGLEPFEINLMDMQGRLLKADFVPADKGETYINLSGWSEGMYYVSVHSNTVHYSTKIIKY
jgi:hypothetical protein